MASLESWPRIVCERFDGESAEGYGRRSRRIIEIVTAFRLGRYDAEAGEQMERELLTLQDPISAYDVPDIAAVAMGRSSGSRTQPRTLRAA